MRREIPTHWDYSAPKAAQLISLSNSHQLSKMTTMMNTMMTPEITDMINGMMNSKKKALLHRLIRMLNARVL